MVGLGWTQEDVLKNMQAKACIAPWKTAADRCATGLKPQGTSASCLLARSSQQSHDVDDAAIVPIRTGSRLSPEDTQTPTG
jgi:hypothetical protein